MIIDVNGQRYDSIDEFVKSKKKDKGTIQQALYSKFTANDHLKFKDILVETGNAKLQEKKHKALPTLSIDLMRLRKKPSGKTE